MNFIELGDIGGDAVKALPMFRRSRHVDEGEDLITVSLFPVDQRTVAQQRALLPELVQRTGGTPQRQNSGFVGSDEIA